MSFLLHIFNPKSEVYHQRQKKAGILFLVVACIVGIWYLASHGLNTTGDTGVLAIKDTDWVKGSDRAVVTLVEYADFQCPACAVISPIIKGFGEKYFDDLKIVYRHFPLTTIHQNSLLSAQASEAAGKQNKFWEMHDILYAKQNEWSNSVNATDFFSIYANDLGLDVELFNKDISSSETASAVENGIKEAKALVLSGTPSLFLNGKKVNLQSAEQFESLIVSEIAASVATQIETTATAVHWHFDVAVILDGKNIDLSLEKYQSTSEKKLSDNVNLQNNNGKVVHVYNTSVTLQDFFKSIGMDITQACFTLDNDGKYCNSNSKSLKVYVNGQKESRLGFYQPKDLDRILITFGPKEDSNLSAQLESVSSDACIYSKTCPERGTSPEDN